jgi:hypothetical protein
MELVAEGCHLGGCLTGALGATVDDTRRLNYQLTSQSGTEQSSAILMALVGPFAFQLNYRGVTVVSC